MSKQTFQLLIFATISLLLAATLVVAAVWHKHKNGAELLEQLSSVQNRSAMEAARSTLEDIETSVLADAEQLNALILEDEADTIELLSTIDSWAEANGVSVDTTRLNIEPVKTGSYDNLMIGLTFFGSESAVMKLVRMMELLPYHSSVESLTFSRSISSSGQSAASASLQLRVAIKRSK